MGVFACKRALLLGVFTLVASMGVAATQDLEGRVIKTLVVTNTGPGVMDDSFVRTHLASQEGKALSSRLVARDIRSLLGTGQFATVETTADERDGGLVLTYLVTTRLRLDGPVEIEGSDALRESTIREAFGLEPEDFFDDHRLAVGIEKIRSEYRDDHYPEVEVRPTVRVTDPVRGRARVKLTVKEGPRARVKDVIFAGSGRLGYGDLIGTMDPPRWWNPFSWFNRMRYNPEDLETARQEIRELYVAQGYLDAVVEPATVERCDDGRLNVRFAIREGCLYRIGTVGLDGITLFPELEFRPMIAMLTRGEVVSMATVDRTAQAIRDYYGSRGYIDTVVTPAQKPTRPAVPGGEGTLDLTFRVQEGALVSIRNIDIQGNSRTRDKVIRREIRVVPGEVFDEVRVRQSQQLLMNLGYFSDVRTLPMEVPRSPDWRDLLVEVEERQTGQFNVGVGFSSIDQVSGFMTIAQNNFDLTGWPYFTGAGQKLKLSASVSSTRQDYEISFEEPWFLDRRLAFGIELFERTVEYDDYDVERTGGSIGLRKALPGWLSGANYVALKYQLERVKVRDVSDTNTYYYLEPYDAVMTDRPYSFEEEQKDSTESSLTLSLTHDTRDNPFLPSRGMRATLAGTVSGGPLAFDTDTYDLSFNGTQYVPLWFKHVLAFRVRAEVVEAFGDSADVPLSDRLFVGGARTVRGFEYRDVGPKVALLETQEDGSTAIVDHRSVGGKTLALGGAEYTIPLVKMIRLAGFYDLGNVWEDSYSMDLTHLAASTGVGLRFDIPGFPIRIDRAWVINKDNPITDEDTWVFWIGQGF